MNKLRKILSLAAVAAMAAVTTAQAATSTNVLVNVTFQFTVYSPGATTTSSAGTTTKIATTTLTTQGLIAALGKDMSITAAPFSSKAILAIAIPLTTTIDGVSVPTPGPPSLVVVDGANMVPIPSSVINFLPASVATSFVNPSAALFSETVSVTSRTSSESFFEAGSLSVNLPNQWVLQLSGTATSTLDSVLVGKGKAATAVPVYTGSADLAGSGTMGAAGTPVIVSGKIMQTYLKTLVQ